MAQLTVGTPTQDGGAGGLVMSGTTPTATTGDTFPNLGGDVELYVNNGSAQATVVTVAGVLDENGRIDDHVTSVAAGSRAILGPFRPGLFNNGTGQVQVTCSVVASVLIQPFRPYRQQR